MDSRQVLAGRPPALTIGKGLLFLGLAALPAWGVVAVIQSPESILNRNGKENFGFGIGFIAVMGLLSLLFLRTTVRVIARWLALGAGVQVEGDRIAFRIPRFARWWSLAPSLEEKVVAATDLRKTCFQTANEASLRIETPAETIEIPSGAFGVGGYTLERRILEQLKTDRPAASAEKTWRAKPAVLATMIALGIAFLLLPGVVLALFDTGNDRAMEAGAKVMGPFMIGGLALLILSFFYRGLVAVDDRGVFFERSGKVSFLGWEDLSRGSVRYQREAYALGLWVNLILSSEAGILKNPACKIGLSRVIGLGFPLKEILETVEKNPSAPR